MKIVAAKQIVTSIGNFDKRTTLLLMKALREAWTAGESSARSNITADVALRSEWNAGYAKAMQEAEAEFQQRAIDYVVGCLKTADEVLKRVA